MHVRIGWGRKFQIRGARFEKQIEADVVRGRNGVKEDWFPLVSWECFVRFSFLQMTCGAVPKWHFCTIRASWRAHRCSMLDNRSSTNRGPTAHCQVAPAVQRIAFLHRPSKRFFCAADMVGTNVEAAYSKSGWITEMKNWRRAVGVSWRDDRRSAPILRAIFLYRWFTCSLHESWSSTITPRSRACVTVFIGVPLHVTAGMSVVDRCVINIATVFSGERLSPFISRASATRGVTGHICGGCATDTERRIFGKIAQISWQNFAE